MPSSGSKASTSSTTRSRCLVRPNLFRGARLTGGRHRLFHREPDRLLRIRAPHLPFQLYTEREPPLCQARRGKGQAPSQLQYALPLARPGAFRTERAAQNIDTLETQAGVRNALQCHGSFATATCLKCKTRFPGSRIQDDILSGRVALCPLCPAPLPPPPRPPKKASANWDSDEDEEEEDEPSEWEAKAIVKPDITFFVRLSPLRRRR